MKKQAISLLIIISMLLGMITITSSAEANSNDLPFSDVPETEWYFMYVKEVCAAGAMQGKSETIFAPEADMTRAEFVTVLCRLSEDDITELDNSLIKQFSDVNPTEWYKDYIKWAVSSDLVKGYSDGTFKPDAPILRQEIAVIFERFFKHQGLSVRGRALTNNFADKDLFPDWAEASIEVLRTTGLIGGDENKNFNPKANASRAEIATIITRLLPYLDAGLSSIHINTKDGNDIVSKEDYVKADFSLKDADGNDVLSTEMKIRGRGNQSWKLDKKPYRLKFSEDVALFSDCDITNNDWILLASHSDKTFLRDTVTFAMGDALDGIEWSPNTEFVEVYLNGEYNGIYVLTERIEASDDKINIKEGDGDDIGFLFELDGYAEGELYTDYFQVFDFLYTMQSDFSSPSQIKELETYLTEAYKSVYFGGYEDALKYIDLDSAIDMYIISEFMVNWDIGFSSFYMYVKEPNGKIFFGPPWDFDFSSGNSNHTINPEGMYIGKGYTPDNKSGPNNPWFTALMKHDWFKKMVRERWNEVSDILKETVDSCFRYARSNYDQISRNFERWDILNKRINVEPTVTLRFKSYEENLVYLENWLNRRWSWLDKHFNSDKFVEKSN